MATERCHVTFPKGLPLLRIACIDFFCSPFWATTKKVYLKFANYATDCVFCGKCRKSIIMQNCVIEVGLVTIHDVIHPAIVWFVEFLLMLSSSTKLSTPLTSSLWRTLLAKKVGCRNMVGREIVHLISISRFVERLWGYSGPDRVWLIRWIARSSVTFRTLEDMRRSGDEKVACSMSW